MITLNRLLLISLLITATLLNVSCKKNEVIPEHIKVKKMVLVYMEANNDLRYEALTSINRMEKAAKDIDGTLLVYIKTSSTRSYLLKIKYDQDENRIMSDTVKTYNHGVTADPEFLKDVVNDSQREYPAETYGLILWSHATAWAPPASLVVKTKSFGRDNGLETDIIDLKNALPNNFEFIIFDACSMGGVEVLYEFKDKARYIIASPAETIAESFPYQLITPFLFKGPDQLKDVAQAYYHYYNSYTDERQSATVSLIQTSELPQLAAEMKSLIRKTKVYGNQFISTNVQRLDFTTGFPVANYDFGDFLTHNWQPEESTGIALQLKKVILYQAATKNFLGKPIKAFSGLTCYIPFYNDTNLMYYKRLQWYSSSGFNILFEK